MVQSDLIQQYGKLPSDLWQREESPDFRLAAHTILKSFHSGRILDVGCYRGDFLKMLPKSFQKFGVEPSQSARKISQHLGINLIGTSIDEINMNKPRFHAITLLDVIEHLTHPLLSLRKLRELLLPEGLLILSTGNTDSLPWRIMRLDYWYYFSEHVSFFNPRWFKWAGRQLDLKVVLLKRFSHFGDSIFERLRQLAHCFAFRLAKGLESTSRCQKVLSSLQLFNRTKQWSHSPSAHRWRDHMFVVLKSTAY
jgi:SAM-dependent methyltransferase